MAALSSDEVEQLLRSEAPPERLIGSVVGGRYRVTSVIGRGGMGVVLAAEHMALGTPVALKVLLGAVAAKPTVAERFVREARAASAIGHPNIVRVHDLGTLDSGQPYLAMEMLEGEDLDGALEHTPIFSPAETIAILRPIASAIDAVHATGVVHRDIKPANIFLAKGFDGKIVPKLVDFGLAAFREGSHEQRLTETGLVVGTPHYLPPETGTGAPMTPDGDVYSLATVAFEMLSGNIPFDAPHPTALMIAKLQNDPPTVSSMAQRPFSDGVEGVFARALSRMPDQRWQKAAEFVDGLEEALREGGDVMGSTRIASGAGTVESIRPRLPLPSSPLSPRKFAPPEAPAEDLALDFETSPEPSSLDADDGPATEEVPVALTPDMRTPRMSETGELIVPQSNRSVLWLALVGVLLVGGLIAWMTLGGDDEVAQSDPTDVPTETVPIPTTLDPDPAEVPDASAPDASASPVTMDVDPRPVTMNPVSMNPVSMNVAVFMAPTMMETTAMDPTAMDPVTMETVEEAPMVAEMDTTTMGTADPTHNPERSAELLGEGQSAMLRGRVADAARLFREATYHNPRNARAWRGLGGAEERLGHAPEAARAFRRYLQLAPNAQDAESIRQRIQ